MRLPFLFALWLLLASGCGFHLRGSVELPPVMAQTYIYGTPEDSELALAIEQALENAGAVATLEREQATAVLRIHGERYARRVLSVDSTGKVSEYELTYRLNYSLTDGRGEVLVDEQQIEQQRDYLFDPNNVLGAGDEEGRLRVEMRNAAIRQMLQRLRSTLRSNPPPASTASPS